MTLLENDLLGEGSRVKNSRQRGNIEIEKKMRKKDKYDNELLQAYRIQLVIAAIFTVIILLILLFR